MKFQRRHQKNFLTFVTGGPNIYKGRDMREVHKHLNLADIHFNQIKKDLDDTLTELKVDRKLTQQVLDLVESLRGEVIGTVELKRDDGRECCNMCNVF